MKESVGLQSYQPVTDLIEIKKLVSVRSPFERNADEIYRIIAKSECLLRGHFCLLAGLHSDVFLRYSQIRQAREFQGPIADLLVKGLKAEKIDFEAIICPEAAGQALGFALEHRMEAPGPKMIVAKTDDNKRPTHLVNYMPRPELGARVLVVNDLLTTGEGIDRLVKIVERMPGAKAQALCLFATRDSSKLEEMARCTELRKAICLIELSGKVWNASDCPLCKEGTPAVRGRDLN
jgi:orotate phosphoribosyltransferase